MNPEKLVLVVVWGPNFDTQLIPHITPLNINIMEKKIAIKGNNWFLFIAPHPHLVMYVLFGLWFNVPAI